MRLKALTRAHYTRSKEAQGANGKGVHPEHIHSKDRPTIVLGSAKWTAQIVFVEAEETGPSYIPL